MQEKMNRMKSSDENDKTLINRRAFFKWGTGFLSVVTATIIGVPLIGSLFNPKSISKKRFVEIADLDGIPMGEPKRVIFSELVKDAFMVEPATSDVWVIKHSASDVTVFSTICPHLGCSYDWQPATKQFVCPCHSSVFSLEGKVMSGPSPRGLDTLPQKIENGKLFLQWEKYEVGIAEKKLI
jgi:Rieske Fe-S protein